jgi:hypothetical protein
VTTRRYIPRDSKLQLYLTLQLNDFYIIVTSSLYITFFNLIGTSSHHCNLGLLITRTTNQLTDCCPYDATSHGAGHLRISLNQTERITCYEGHSTRHYHKPVESIPRPFALFLKEKSLIQTTHHRKHSSSPKAVLVFIVRVVSLVLNSTYCPYPRLREMNVPVCLSMCFSPRTAGRTMVNFMSLNATF